MNPARATGQLATLTGLRGIAAFAVLFYHIRGSMADFAPAPVNAVLAHGYLAVDLFFVLSGFVLWWTYRAAFAERGSAAVVPFVVRRAARIFPLHIAIMLAMLAFAIALKLSGRAPGGQYPLDQLPAQLLLMQNWGFTDRLAWNDPAWSISTEWAAYLLLALTGGLVTRLRTGPWHFPVLAILAAGGMGLWFGWTGRVSIGADIAATGLLRCVVEFGIGVALCQWWTAMGEQPQRICAVALALGAIGVVLAASGVSQPAGIPLIMAAVVIFALEASLLRRPPLSGAVAQWLGRISYALYLSHFFLWIVFKLLFVADPAVVSPLAVAAFIALALAASHLLHHLVELPGRRLFQQCGDGALAAIAARRARA